MSLDRDAIRRFPVFKDLDEADSRTLGESLTPLNLPAGETLFRFGDAGSSMYLLVAGQVDVLVPVQGDGDHRRATLQPGSVLGEMALLVHGSRSATIVAFSNAVLWQIERRAFEAALKRGDRWAVGLLLEVAKELAGRLSGMSAEFLRLTEELQHRSQPAEPKLAELGRLRQRLFTEWSF